MLNLIWKWGLLLYSNKEKKHIQLINITKLKEIYFNNNKIEENISIINK